jgi:hypothetical protein
MLFIEFQTNINSGINILKYRNINDDIWHYLYIDIETLNLLVTNYGIISTYKIPTKFTNCDNPTTSKIINLKYWTKTTSVSLLFHYVKRFFEDLKNMYI